MGSFKTLAPLICCALLMQSAGVTAGQATDYVDVLDLPAKASALAQRSPLLDLARAGANESIESAVDPKAYGIDLRRYLA